MSASPASQHLNGETKIRAKLTRPKNLYPIKMINQKRHALLAPAWPLDPVTDAGCWGAMSSVIRQAAISESHHEES